MRLTATSIVLAALAGGPLGCAAFAFQAPLMKHQQQQQQQQHNRAQAGVVSGLIDHRHQRESRSFASLALATDDDNNNNNSVEQDEEQEEVPTLPASTEAHALEVFDRYSSAGKKFEGQKFISEPSALFHILCSLDIEATQEDADIVFRYLDTDGDGRLMFEDEFLPWYLEAVGAASGFSASFQSLLIGRRTVEAFDATSVDDAVLERAVQCAISAPNRSGSEPWRFCKVGPATISKLAALNADLAGEDASEGKFTRYTDWEQVAPGWCVVTRKITGEADDEHVLDTPSQSEQQQDFKSVCCAIQNFMLSMWSEGIGTKWTTGPVQTTAQFAEICGIDTSQERVVGIIWYGYATGGTKYADPKRRKLAVEDVLGYLP